MKRNPNRRIGVLIEGQVAVADRLSNRRRASIEAGGIYMTAADVHAPWNAPFAGRIVSLDTVAEMMRPRSDVPENVDELRAR